MDKEARSKHLQMDRILGKKVDSRKEEGTAGKIGYFDFYPFLITKKEKKKKKIRPTPLKIEEKAYKEEALALWFPCFVWAITDVEVKAQRIPAPSQAAPDNGREQEPQRQEPRSRDEKRKVQKTPNIRSVRRQEHERQHPHQDVRIHNERLCT
ncbi:Serine/Threonine-Protein Phosphatase 2A Regulatory Subunit B'' Subunit Beta [Manis pentadactyla]|nr:Serine/Threonine-Protein Phosphatase 2A Regulatory Subunit B'' Subunit Beta [Manis pentadactyla]